MKPQDWRRLSYTMAGREELLLPPPPPPPWPSLILLLVGLHTNIVWLLLMSEQKNGRWTPFLIRKLLDEPAQCQRFVRVLHPLPVRIPESNEKCRVIRAYKYVPICLWVRVPVRLYLSTLPSYLSTTAGAGGLRQFTLAMELTVTNSWSLPSSSIACQ